MKGLLLSAICLFSIVGCYKVRYQAPVQIQGTLSDARANERITNFCAEVTYQTTVGSVTETSIEKMCNLPSSLQGGVLTSTFEFKVRKEAESYNVKNINNITLITQAVDNPNCENCTRTTYNRSYRGEVISFDDSTGVIQIEITFGVASETSSKKWINSMEVVRLGCSILSDYNNVQLCLSKRLAPEKAMICLTTTHSVEDEYMCLLTSSDD